MLIRIFTVYLVGGDGTAISTGTASNGVFEADVNEDNEVVLDFTCGQTCFGKPASTDLICDPISSAVISALEISPWNLGQIQHFISRSVHFKK